jgi:hypothetical protein
MHHCHNNLLGTTIKFLGAAPVFAGERAEFKIAVCNDAAAARLEIELKYRAHTAGPVDVADGGTEILRVGVPTDGASGGTHGKQHAGDDDFAGLRSAAPGDPLQRIAWKAYARNDLLLLKEFASGAGEPCLLDWELLPELDVEQRIAQLTRWCLDADAAGRSLALRLPGESVPLGQGPKHLAACLEALALFQPPR